jgi:hypothetical protein
MTEEITPDQRWEGNKEKILKHKNNVLQNCLELGKQVKRLEIFNGESDRFARQLIMRGYIHDLSKLDGIEWFYLHRGEEFLHLAHEHHVRTNDHHPEFWAGGMKEMPEIAVAEWVCDIKARSSEFGTDLRDWVRNTALDKYDISSKGKAYKTIKKYLDILLEEPF